MPRNVKVTAISIPKHLLPDIESRKKQLGLTSRSGYICHLIHNDIADGGELKIAVRKK
jgi:metal-responsive CopG/Arc/MetJ family transcriptional regulator